MSGGRSWGSWGRFSRKEDVSKDPSGGIKTEETNVSSTAG